MDLELFSKGDVYIDDPYQDCKFRFDHATGKYYARYYGRDESEIKHTNSFFREALRGGKVITRDEYYDRDGAAP
jgi:hypothetical protein